MRFVIALTLILVCCDALAANSQAEKATNKVAQDAFMVVGITYLCGGSLAASDADSARSKAEDALQLLGLDENQAIISVDAFYRRTKRENPGKVPIAGAEKCLSLLITAQENLRSSEAKYRKLKRQ